MDEVKLAIVMLCVVVFFLAVALVIANIRMTRFASKALEHAMAWSVDQREFMRSRMEAEKQELLLREARMRDQQSMRIPIRHESVEPPEPMIPIEPNNLS